MQSATHSTATLVSPQSKPLIFKKYDVNGKLVAFGLACSKTVVLREYPSLAAQLVAEAWVLEVC
jgi:hypothetical protein